MEECALDVCTVHFNVHAGGVVNDACAGLHHHILQNELAELRLKGWVAVIILAGIDLAKLTDIVQPLRILHADALDPACNLRYIAVGGQTAQGNALFKHDDVQTAACRADSGSTATDTAADDGEVTEQIFSYRLHNVLLLVCKCLCLLSNTIRLLTIIAYMFCARLANQKQGICFQKGKEVPGGQMLPHLPAGVFQLYFPTNSWTHFRSFRSAGQEMFLRCI